MKIFNELTVHRTSSIIIIISQQRSKQLEKPLLLFFKIDYIKTKD
jgi:hypothetical protein